MHRYKSAGPPSGHVRNIRNAASTEDGVFFLDFGYVCPMLVNYVEDVIPSCAKRLRTMRAQLAITRMAIGIVEVMAESDSLFDHVFDRISLLKMIFDAGRRVCALLVRSMTSTSWWEILSVGGFFQPKMLCIVTP